MPRRIVRIVHCVLVCSALALPLLLGACASSTNSGAIGVNRRQLLLVSADSLEQAATNSFAELNQKAQRAGALVQGAEADNLRNIAGRLVGQVGVFRQDALRWNWQVSLINSNELNAFCMPGGKIVFYTGIIRKLQLTNDEIAAVMGHEIAHALREHSREQASEQLGTGLLTGLVGAGASALGLPSGAGQLGNQAMTYLVTLPHSRRHETEADQLGLELMARAGYNPQAAVNVWKKMQAAGGASPPQFLSTHPSHSTRIRDLQNLMPVVWPLYRQAGGRAPH